MNEENKSMEEIIAISYFDTDNMDIKNHVDRYFEIKRDIINVLNKYNIMWILTDTNEFNNKDKEIKRLNKRWNELKTYINDMWLDDKGSVRRLQEFVKLLESESDK